MASFDFTKFDKYVYDLTLIPQGVVKAAGVNEPDAAGNLTSVFLPTPDNFTQFPNQRVFLEFNGASFNANDNEELTPEPDKVYQFYLVLDVPCRWCYDNFSNSTNATGNVYTHQSITSIQGQPTAKQTQAKIPFGTNNFLNGNDEISRVFTDTPLNRNVIQIASPFGSELNIQFKRQSSEETIYVGVADGNPLLYDNLLSPPMLFKSPVSISFSIYVERDYKEVEAFQKMRIN